MGYIRLSGFSDHASDQFLAALTEDVDAGRTKLIVDLRGNPGGYVTAARDIASQFIADGPIFWQEAADGSLLETQAKPGGVAVDPSDQGHAPGRWRFGVGVGDRGRRAP